MCVEIRVTSPLTFPETLEVWQYAVGPRYFLD